MSRISSQGTVVMVQSDAAPTSEVITGVTKAKPAVLSITDSAVAVGDIVIPRGTGFASLDDRPFAVKAVTASSVTLEDSDTSRETGTATAGTLEAPVFIELCRSTFVVNQPQGATIDVTTLCDEAHRIVSGLPAISTWQANGFYDASDAAMLRAAGLYRSGDFAAFHVKFRDGSGFAFSGNVNVFDVSAGINAAVTNNISGQIDGRVSMVPASP